MSKFKISSNFSPAGDQPKAIEKLVAGINKNDKFQTLLGVTGSGKTFTVAKVIEKVQRPTLVIAHNKTLAAQLAQEFRTFFPKNAVEYFVSYYDYYQPEAYIASTDTYIEKEAQINDEIDRLRHAATSALMSREDVVIVASVSCIYGLGSPEFYERFSLKISRGEKINREDLAEKLLELRYDRADLLVRGKFRLRGNIFEIVSPAREIATRIEIDQDKVKKIFEYDLLTGEELGNLEKIHVFPAKHFVVPEPLMQAALGEIEKELKERVSYLKKHNKLLEAERLARRTSQDIEMMKEVGYCNGIENYSRYLSGRSEGQAPYTLMDYFPNNFLTVIDESHVTIPQLNGMYNGDRSRKESLVENGFRLPSAFDNRPLKFPEFEEKINQLIFTSATPGSYEREKSRQIVEQIIRPTGLIDPELVIKPARGQVKDVIEEIKKTIGIPETANPQSISLSSRPNPTLREGWGEAEGSLSKSKRDSSARRNDSLGMTRREKGRVLVTTLTKKMAEDLSEFLIENKIKAKYLHSGVDTLDRIKILEDLRRGNFDVLVGVNLLREGLDLPEVILVAILDADKEGFLRSDTSLIQTIGRAARNVFGKVILYADHVTGSMKRAITETNRRRKLQAAYNQRHAITPKTIRKKIESIVDHEIKPAVTRDFSELETLEDIAGYIKQREIEMKTAARNLEFEKAAIIRDEIGELRKLQLK